MAFPNTSITDIVATTLEYRSPEIADNVTDNNGLLTWLKKAGQVKPVSGGRTIYEPFSFAENGNGGWYSGYDTLQTAAQDVISGAEFAWKQAAVPVVISGLEELQNDGKEALIDLLEARLRVAESTLANLISVGLYSDGTGSGSKQLTGLDAAVPADPTTGTYGGINRATAGNEFWRSQKVDPGSTPTASTIRGVMNDLYVDCSRGGDKPNLVILDDVLWSMYLDSLQGLQRFTSTNSAGAGFDTVKFMSADVIYDGGIGGNATASTGYFLNTKYLHFRPHKKRNFVPLRPDKRAPVNQDATVSIIAFAGNLTCSGARFQGRLIGT